MGGYAGKTQETLQNREKEGNFSKKALGDELLRGHGKEEIPKKKGPEKKKTR